MNTQVVADTLNNDGDAIVTAFADALASGDASVADWSARYPELGRDFARVAAQNFAENRETRASAPTDMTHSDALANRLRSVARNTLLRYKTAYIGEEPLVSLVDKERGITAARIAQATLLPLPFVAKLNQRLFTAASIPTAAVARIADAIGRSVEDVRVFLAGPPMLARAAAYRSDDAPMVGEQEDFTAALQSDEGVSPEARALYRG